ncbi:hypothetical protein AAL_02081 [Moelleriella libera RCEF 2490]|uniref:Uncharacterized protein n=1 Tax=Moelleriella libera RCEF 2490 TaxID=1081109 RepID=A0A168F5U0_9HYPO|nr:hypothetical protein AAL_02081 [Moelleriella libera RCEF 2490]
MSDSSDSQVSIVVISLKRRRPYDYSIEPVLTALWGAHTYSRIVSPLDAIWQLAFHPPTAAVITDEAIASRANWHVLLFLLHYVRQGGTAVFMGDFPRYMSADRVRAFFSRFGLPWKYSSLNTLPMFQNRLAVGWQRLEGRGRNRPMPPVFHLRGVYLKGVLPRDMLYQTTDPTDDSEGAAEGAATPVSTPHQTDVSRDDAKCNDGETAIAVAEVGRGKLCYVGEILRTTECSEIILALCGL